MNLTSIGLAFAVGLALNAAPMQAARAADPAVPSAMTAAEFVRRAALSDMFETKSSEMAAVKADEPTRAFAATMNADHQKTSSELNVIVKGRAADLPLPARLDASRQRELDALDQLDGAAFTQRYRDDQVKAHASAVKLFESYARVGSDQRLRDWAAATLPKLQEHLDHARSLARS